MLQPQTFIKNLQPWLGWLSGMGVILQSKRLSVQFLVRAHAWVVSLVLGQGLYERQLINVSLSHQCFSFSLSPSFSSLKKKIFFKKSTVYDTFDQTWEIEIQCKWEDICYENKTPMSMEVSTMALAFEKRKELYLCWLQVDRSQGSELSPFIQDMGWGFKG